MKFLIALLASVLPLLAQSPFADVTLAQVQFVSSGSSPTWTPSNNIAGMALWLSYKDVPLYDTWGGPWVDRIRGLSWYTNNNVAMTNYDILGLRLKGNWLTNATGLTVPSNSVFWVVYTEESSDTYGAWLDSGNRTDGWFTRPSPSMAYFYAGTQSLANTNFSLASLPTVLIWLNGTIYTNGVMLGVTASNAMTAALDNIGQANVTERILRGKIENMGVWTNVAHNWTQSTVDALTAYSLTNSATNVTSGLLAWWKFDENTGSTVLDSSGNGWNGYLTNQLSSYNPIWTNAQIQSGLAFGGKDLGNALATNYVVITNSASLANNLSEMSISLWVRNPTNGAAGHQPKVVLSKIGRDALGTDDRYPGWEVHWDDSSISTYIVQSNTASTTTATSLWGAYCTTIRGNTNWHHYVVVKNSSGTNLMQFVDGLQVNVNSYNGSSLGPVTNYSSPQNIVIGWIENTPQVTPSDKIFGGELDDIRIYNRTLSTNEVWSLFKWGKWWKEY